jgi:hypothetical protein
MSLILATWEEEIRRLTIQDQGDPYLNQYVGSINRRDQVGQKFETLFEK